MIPAFNEEKSIGQVLESLKNQDIKIPFEVIVVDNNSSDATADIVNSYKDKITNLALDVEHVRGIGAARETGFKISQAPIIASTDADTLLPSNWLSTILSTFETHPDIAAMVGIYDFYSKSRLFNFAARAIMITGDTLHRILTGSYGFRGLNFAIRREAWLKSGGFNVQISALEDVDLSLRVARVGKIMYVPSLSIKTGYRRFEGRFWEQLIKRLATYYYRVILRDTTHFTYWEPIRE